MKGYTFLNDYDETIGKQVVEVRSHSEDYDDPADFTLMIFSDDTALLIRHQSYWTTRSGITKPEDEESSVRKGLGL